MKYRGCVNGLNLKMNLSKSKKESSIMNIVSELKKRSLKRAKEFYVYILPIIKGSYNTDKKFIIFAQARTGSRLLGDLLNSHPEIHCDREIFLNKNLFFPELYLRRLSTRDTKKVYGCQIKLYQLTKYQNIDAEKFLLSLHKNRWKIIYLERKNLLRQSISAMIAAIRKEYCDTAENPLKNSKFYIDCDELITGIEYYERQLIEEKKLLKKLPHIMLIYEDDLLTAEEHQKSLDRIFDYLGLNTVPVKTTLVKTSSDNMSNFIQNYNEVVSVVNKTKYSQFLKY